MQKNDRRTIAGPASAYPTFRTPASICFSEPNDVFVPGLIAGTSQVCLAGLCGRRTDHAELGGTQSLMIAVAKKRRRLWLIFSTIFYLRLNSFRRKRVHLSSSWH